MDVLLLSDGVSKLLLSDGVSNLLLGEPDVSEPDVSEPDVAATGLYFLTVGGNRTLLKVSGNSRLGDLTRG